MQFYFKMYFKNDYRKIIVYTSDYYYSEEDAIRDASKWNLNIYGFYVDAC
jgi:hypothetical protein